MTSPTKATKESPWAADKPKYRPKVSSRAIGFSLLVGLPALFLFSNCGWLQHPPHLTLVQGRGAGFVSPGDDVVGTVKWWQCEGSGHAPGAECGYIIVPLNYLNASAGVAKIALGKYKATSEPRKGMVLFNPGGPGGPGKPVATDAGPAFQSIIGTQWDFVGFDPRGIGETEPAVNCFGTHQNYNIFKTNTVLDKGFDVGPNLTDLRTRDHLILQQRDADSLYQTQFALCGKTMGDALKYMGTSTVVRDIDFITTALEGKDALINFYGASYGTVIGAYLVNMFPGRIGRVVIDGVVDVVQWASLPAYKWYRTWQVDAESAYKLFLQGCAQAGPSVCPLSKAKNENPSAIEKRIEDFFAELYLHPLAVTNGTRPTFLNNGRARIALFGALQRPRTWPAAALALYHAMQGDGAQLLNLGISDSARDLERSAVSCNDNLPFPAPSPEEVIDESLDVLKTVTRFGLAVAITEPDSGCQFWPVTPPERFEGPWNHTLRNPILIHSNLADAATPLSSGRKLKQLLGNSSRLAIREGPGHCSFSLSSLCTVKITQNYFKDGTLPPNEHLCPLDETPFPDPDSDHSLHILTEEDASLLKQLKIIGDALESVVHRFGL